MQVNMHMYYCVYPKTNSRNHFMNSSIKCGHKHKSIHVFAHTQILTMTSVFKHKIFQSIIKEHFWD